MDKCLKESEGYLQGIIETFREISGMAQTIKNIDVFIRGCCNVLHKKRSYIFAAIILFDKNENLSTYSSSGISIDPVSFGKMSKTGVFPPDIQKAFDTNDLVINTGVSSGCPWTVDFNGQCVFTRALETNGNRHGFLCVSLDKEKASHSGEQMLFNDLAINISFALQNLKYSLDFEHFFNDSPDGYLALDKELTILKVNQSLCNFVNASPEELVGFSGLILAKKFFQGNNLASLQKAAEQLSCGEEIRNLELDLEGKWYLISTNFTKLSQLRIVVVRDITKVKKAEDAVLENAAKYRNLVESLKDSLLIVLDGKVKYSNPVFCQLTEYPCKELKEKTFLDLFRQDQVEDIEDYLNKALTRRKCETVHEAVLISRKKDEIPVEISLIPVDYEGKRAGQIVLKDISKYKQALSMVKESEERFRFLTESTFEGIVVHKKGVVLDTNESFLKLLGISKDEVIGKNLVTEIINPHSLINVKKNIQKSYARPYVILSQKKDGTQFYCELEGRDVLYRGESVRIAAVRDVTERYVLQQKVTESQQKLQNLLANLPGIAYTCKSNPEREMVLISDGCYEMLGYWPEEIIGKKQPSFGELIHEGDRQRVWSVLKKQFSRESFFELEYRIINKSGEIRWVLDKGKPVKSNDGILFEGFINDVTERKKAEEDLINSEKRFQVLSNSGFEAIFVSEGGICTDQNKAAEELFGYTLAEALGKPGTDWIAPEDREMVREKMQQSVSIPYQVSGLRKDGSVFPCEIQASTTEIEGRVVRITALRDISQTKEAEKELKSSEEKFRMIFENKGTATAILDAEGRILLANQRCVELLGYNTEELQSGMTWMDMAHPDDLKRMKHEHFLRNNDPSRAMSSYEIRMIKKNGVCRDYILNIQLVGNRKERIASLIDITERKETERKLKESEQKFKSYLQNAPFGVFIADEQGFYQEVNIAAQIITGYSREELLEMNLTDLLQEEYRESAIDIFKKLINKKEQVELEMGYVCKSGEKRLWNLVGVYTADNLFMGFTQDITQRKIDEEKILSLLHDQKVMLDNDPSFIIYKDTKNNILRITNTVARMTGLPKDKIEGHHASVVYYDMADKYYEDDLEVISSGMPKMGIIEKLDTKNGDVRWLLSNKIPYRDNGKDISGIVLFSTDITDLKRYEDELLEKNRLLTLQKEKAEESDRLKSAFLTNMSHEIRTPMNGILGFTSLLQESQLSPDDQQGFLKIIQKSGERMLDTINDIIDISIIESGSVKITPGDLNPDEVIEELCTFFRLEAEEKGIELRLKKESSVHNFVTDEHKFNSILTNLIKNAIKFTKKGFVEIDYRLNNDVLRINVRDTGIGIPKAKLTKIFNRFEKVDDSHTRNYEGSGLGLAITKSFIELLNGEIRVSSTEGKGTVFSVTLPTLKDNIEIIRNQSSGRVKSNTSKMKKKLNILIAEDDETSFLLLESILEDMTDKVLNAKNGKEAVQFLKDNPETDLVFMDIKMPIVDGLMATKLIREFNKEIIIIAQTAHAGVADAINALEAGCNDYLSKPIDKNKLLALIHKYFD